jgi:hypothetical protein
MLGSSYEILLNVQITPRNRMIDLLAHLVESCKHNVITPFRDIIHRPQCRGN